MELRDRLTETFDRKKGDFLVLALLLGFGFFINRGVELEGLYMDDLYLWSCYGEQSFREFVFPVGSTRFRFIFYLEAWLELLLLGNHVTWMVPFNIVLNALIAFTLYRIAARMSGGRRLVSLALGFAYLLSRFAYYQISQFYGLMESTALWAAVGILYFLYRYVNERDTGSYFGACGLYFAVCFIHERYMALLPVLLLALAMGKRPGTAAVVRGAGEKRRTGQNGREEAAAAEERDEPGTRGRSRSRRKDGGERRQAGAGRRDGWSGRGAEAGRYGRTAKPEAFSKWPLLGLTVCVFVLVQAIRLAAIGTLSPAGTGGTDVSDTFQMDTVIRQGLEQAAFVFGRNSGPDYLCIQTFEDSPELIRTLILASNVVLAAIVAVFLVRMLCDRGHVAAHAKNVLLFLAFIALCIGSSSVTIRVEMRWVYVVYAAALLFLGYMSGRLGKAGILAFLYVALLVPTETYYRDHWENFYYMPNQLRCNSLAEQTVGRYGEDIFDRQVYIIGNTYALSDFTARTFLKVYAGGEERANTTIEFIDSDFDFKEITDDVVILAEDPEHNAYQDVTDFVRKQRWNLAYGSYEDGWVDEHAKIVFLNGDCEKLTLNCYYPGKITGNEVCEVRVNGERLPNLVFTENMMHYELDTAPYQVISLELSSNFHVEGAQEKRGDEELAMIVTMDEN